MPTVLREGSLWALPSPDSQERLKGGGAGASPFKGTAQFRSTCFQLPPPVLHRFVTAAVAQSPTSPPPLRRIPSSPILTFVAYFRRHPLSPLCIASGPSLQSPSLSGTTVLLDCKSEVAMAHGWAFSDPKLPPVLYFEVTLHVLTDEECPEWYVGLTAKGMVEGTGSACCVQASNSRRPATEGGGVQPRHHHEQGLYIMDHSFRASAAPAAVDLLLMASAVRQRQVNG